MYILIEKWYDFDNKTTNLLKYAVFEINDLRCGGGDFSENFGMVAAVFVETRHSTSLQTIFGLLPKKLYFCPP